MEASQSNSFDTIDEVDINPELVKFWSKLKRTPTVIVFDLDYTLWGYFVDFQEPPFVAARKDKKDILVDQNNFELSHFKDVSVIIKTLKQACFKNGEYLAIASRSTTPDLAMQLIKFFGWHRFLDCVQIYPKSKDNHMNVIKNELKLASFKEFLFFDDETYNIKTTSPMGVVSIELDTKTGLNMDALLQGLKTFESKK